MGVYPPKHTHGCICLHFLTDKLTDRQTKLLKVAKMRFSSFVHGIRFEWSALEALFVQTCSLHTVRLKHNIRGLYNKIWYQNHKLLVTIFSHLGQNKRRNSFCSFARARTAHSTYSLCSAPLWYAHFAMISCLLRPQDRSFTSHTPS